MRDGDTMLLIESAIEREYLLNAWKRFWPAQFITAELPEREVLEALKCLADAGKLAAEAFLRCSEGDVVWKGSPSEVQGEFEKVCRRCDEPVNALDGVELQFTITAEWRQHLEQLREDLQKKTLHTSPGSR